MLWPDAVGLINNLTPAVFAGGLCSKHRQFLGRELEIVVAFGIGEEEIGLFVVKYAWQIQEYLNSLPILLEMTYLCIKKMMDTNSTVQIIKEVLSSEDKLEAFYENLLFEINNDDEAYYKKGRQLLLASLSNEHPDDFFIAICGWSLESLLKRI